MTLDAESLYKEYFLSRRDSLAVATALEPGEEVAPLTHANRERLRDMYLERDMTFITLTVNRQLGVIRAYVTDLDDRYLYYDVVIEPGEEVNNLVLSILASEKFRQSISDLDLHKF